jgi:SpoIID/LytB domain protein
LKTTSTKTETAARAPRRLGALAREARAFVRAPRAPRGFAHACVCVTLLFAWTLPGAPDGSRPRTPSSSVVAPGEEEVDESLRRAARNALGGREGTVLVLDARTGRVRAVVNPRLAFEETFAPGSTVKPFTMLEALRARVVGEETRVACRHTFRHEDFEINCSHPPAREALGPAQALALSCNYFFGRAGERVEGEALTRTLAAYGFGARTGGGAEHEAPGRLPARGRWRVSDALGESEQLLVTPAQLASAYAALFNGGRLYAPRVAPAEGFTPRVRARLEIEAAHRALLVEGMRGAVAYGSAARADLNTLGAYVFGKTGTSTPPGDFRTQGWFVGLAAEKGADGGVAPESVGLAVLVLLKRGHGSDAAEVARPVFREHARVEELRRAAAASKQSEGDESESAGRADVDGGRAISPQAAPGETFVRVHMSRADRTLALPLDEYVFGVVAAEGSVEDEFEALKAQTVVSRTYALKNLRRHAREGFDFCSSTHCQRYIAVGDGAARPDFYELLRRAVRETSGETLRDREGRLAESYFSASCGGATANPVALWGAARAPAHLRGVRDEFCAGTAYRAWRDSIAAADLVKALRADKQSDVGARLDAVLVLRRDPSGRAETVALEGERRRVLRGWDFKLIVGRTLGWNVLKSSRFDVTRAGNNFVFRGSGFGHGLGLCQSGAHVMARRGASYRQIVGYFFPGAGVGKQSKRSGTPDNADAATREETRDETGNGTPVESDAHVRRDTNDHRDTHDQSEPHDHGDARARQDPAAAFRTAAFRGGDNFITQRAAEDVPPAALFRRAALFTRATPNEARGARSPRLTLSSEHFRASYPARAARREVEAMLRALEGARRDVLGRLDGAGLSANGLGTAELYVHETTGDFTGSTGLPAWVAASTEGRRIRTQPPEVLRRRGVLSSTMRHELVHVVLEALGRGRAPLWLVEGLAAHVAGEGPMLSRSARGAAKLSLEEIERGLSRAASAQETRALYAAAHAEVAALIRREGEAAAWRRALRG